MPPGLDIASVMHLRGLCLYAFCPVSCTFEEISEELMREATPATRRAPSDGSPNRQARTRLRTLAAEKNRRRSSGSFMATNAPITCSNDCMAPIGSNDPSAVVEWVATTRSVTSRQPPGGGDASV